MDKSQLTDRLRTKATQLGFCLVGACPAVTPQGYHRFLEWLERGYAGEMDYLPNRADAYRHPRSVLPGVTSLLMLALNYHSGPRQPPQPGEGSIASYAWGEVDYHDLIRAKLKRLKRFLLELHGSAAVRGVVDTAPLLEREFAQLAGLGWLGKNTLLLNKQHGSYFFLAALLTDLELDYDEPFELDHCGTCTACLDHCPTNAFPQPYVLDSRRCISYLTIEHRGDVDEELRGRWDDWLFGCDICQEVCPWNHRVASGQESAFQPTAQTNPVDLIALFDLDEHQFRQRFRATPLWRAKRRGLLRNAALLLGTQQCQDAVAALEKGARDTDSLVQSASRWALTRIRGRAANAEIPQRPATD